jgi:hypothetical protein
LAGGASVEMVNPAKLARGQTGADSPGSYPKKVSNT